MGMVVQRRGRTKRASLRRQRRSQSSTQSLQISNGKCGAARWALRAFFARIFDHGMVTDSQLHGVCLGLSVLTTSEQEAERDHEGSTAKQIAVVVGDIKSKHQVISRCREFDDCIVCCSRCRAERERGWGVRRCECGCDERERVGSKW